MLRHSCRVSARRAKRLSLAALGAAVLLLSPLTAGFTTTALAVSAPSGHPNRYAPSSASTSVLHPAPRTSTSTAAVTALAPAFQPPSVPMQPAEIPVTPAGGQLLGGDGALEIDVPAGAVTAADVTAAGGAMSLLVRQVLPASGGTAGGSGLVTFGSYLVQVLDAQRQVWTGTLHQPLGTQLHASARAGALDLGSTLLVLNQTLPSWFDATPLAAPPVTPASGARQQKPAARTAAPKSSQPVLGKRSSVRPAVSTGSGAPVLSAPVTLSGSSMSMTWDTGCRSPASAGRTRSSPV